MKLYSNILFPLTKPWAIKAAGQPFVYFDYNAAGDNTRVYSSIANDWERIYAYDLLGRKLTYTEGELWDSYTYNGMNLSTYRQRWQESGQIRNKTTLYHYNAHRLDSVTYDDALSTVYHYDQYGRVDSLYDESGVMCYEYGNMGEVTKETRIYALPFLSQPLALSTQFEYDSWGRILNITYPDNEVVNYIYDLGGKLFTMSNYLDSVLYDKFGAKISQKYGNGIKTDYTYDPITRRLSNITTLNGNSQLSAIAYTYDLVGNVTQVASTCPWLPNQSFIENFNYDSADQLTAAQENQNNGYQLTVNYGHWGKVNNYDLAQTDFINNTSTGDSRLFTYPSDPNNLQVAQTIFAPEQCNGTADILFSFGINGSLRKRETTQPQQHTEYYLFNSQGNLKAYSDDIMDFAYYGYNAANTRTYKLSLYNTNLWINGQQQPLNMQLQNAMFYPNTYLNFNSNGEYTKHYYNGTERIASRLGDNTTTIALNNNILEARKLQLEEQFRVDIHKLIEETVPIDMPPFIDVNTLQPTGTPNDIYYYHPNHLGSTSFVTDQNQNITQGFLYAPFGEITTEYNINFGNNVIPKYSFNAKELDEETVMYYYEARYYAPPTFTSRDPLFEKYFWMTPYAYCANNPVKYVDPSGRKIIIVCPETGKKVKYKPEMSVPKRSSKFVSDAITGLNFLYNNPEGDKNRVADIVNAEPVLTIIQQSIGKSSRYNPNNQTLSWDNQSIDVYETGSQSAIVGFAHEIDHASISIPALDRVWKYEDGVLQDQKAYIQDCGDAKLVTLPGDMKYENSAISYENFIGNLTYGERKLSTYFRSSYIPPKETIRTNSIFMIE